MRKLQKVGVSIFINLISLLNIVYTKTLKSVHLKLTAHFQTSAFYLIYRLPIGNFNTFVTKLDKILQKLCTIKSNPIICDDGNVNYLQESDKKSQLNPL